MQLQPGHPAGVWPLLQLLLALGRVTDASAIAVAASAASAAASAGQRAAVAADQRAATPPQTPIRTQWGSPEVGDRVAGNRAGNRDLAAAAALLLEADAEDIDLDELVSRSDVSIPAQL